MLRIINTRILRQTSGFIWILAAGLAHAQQGSEPASIIEMALLHGHAVEGFVYGVPVVAVPLANRPCPSVGIVFQEKRRHREAQRIDSYAACPGEEAELMRDTPPGLPEDAQFHQLVQMTIRSALRYGVHRRELYDYRVDARRLSAADPYGCAQLETIVSTLGQLASYNVGRVCP